jgi:hypothetical protein
MYNTVFLFKLLPSYHLCLYFSHSTFSILYSWNSVAKYESVITMAFLWRDGRKNKKFQHCLIQLVIFCTVETTLLSMIQSLLRNFFETLKKQSEFSGTTSGNRTEYLQTRNHKRYSYIDSPPHDSVTYPHSNHFATTSVSFLFLMTGLCVALNRPLC